MSRTTAELDRRTLLTATTALTAAALLPSAASAQTPPNGALPVRGEFLIRGAHVLSMDDAIGDFPVGDVHVRDGAIVAIAASVNAPGVEVVDGKGTICMPGFVDTHWHLWTSCLRPAMRADDPKLTYFPVTLGLGLHYTPDDSYRSVRLGLAEAIAAGVTTTQNWAHNVRSPAHADAEVKAMRDSGIRGRFSYGPAQGMPNDRMMDFADMARLKKELAGDTMIDVGMNSRNVDGNNSSRGAIGPEMAKKEWAAARESGLPITLHTNGTDSIKLLDAANLLGPDVQLVHPLNLAVEDGPLLAKKGVHYTTSPLGEAARSGEMQFIEMMQAGVLTSISIDNIGSERCDCFACMRMLQTVNRHRTGGKFALTTKRLVQMATIDGAKDLGLAGKIGSLTPGKRADLILVRTDEQSTIGNGDPYDTLVQLATPGNVDTVVIDGRILRRGKKFTALDRDRIVADANDTLAALKTRAKWT